MRVLGVLQGPLQQQTVMIFDQKVSQHLGFKSFQRDRHDGKQRSAVFVVDKYEVATITA
jgi:hypothetical protein